MSDLANDQIGRDWSVVVAVKTEALTSITFNPDMPHRYSNSGCGIRTSCPYNVSLEADNSLDGHDLWIKRAPESDDHASLQLILRVELVVDHYVLPGSLVLLCVQKRIHGWAMNPRQLADVVIKH